MSDPMNHPPTPPSVADALAGLTTAREKWAAVFTALGAAVAATRGLYTAAVALAAAAVGAAGSEWAGLRDFVLGMIGGGQ